jgi:hypothetical protein
MFFFALLMILGLIASGTEDTPDATPAVVERAAVLCAPNGGWSRINTYGVPFRKTLISATVVCNNKTSIDWQVED